MCIYTDKSVGKCLKTNSQCPYLYFCTKHNRWKELKNFPEVCKIVEQENIKKGFYKVCFEKRGNLYVEVDGYIRIVANPYDTTPQYVKVYKTKTGEWKVRK